MSRKPAGNDSETNPKSPFGAALRLHLNRGTRPDGQYKRWKIDREFSAASAGDVPFSNSEDANPCSMRLRAAGRDLEIAATTAPWRDLQTAAAVQRNRT